MPFFAVSLLVLAHAADPAAPPPLATWAMVQQALVLESAEGDLRRSIARWEQLVRSELPSDDPSLTEALYWLASARYATGDVEGAREALDQCVRSGMNRSRCTELRGQIDLEVESVRRPPVRWTFDSAAHGFFHPRAYWDKGSIRIQETQDGSVLAWSTDVDAVKEDRLVVGFDAEVVPPEILRFQVRAVLQPATLAIELIDVHGARFAATARPVQVVRHAWTTVDIRLDNVASVEGTGGRLVPVELHRLRIRDISSLSGIVGPNELWIDDFEVR